MVAKQLIASCRWTCLKQKALKFQKAIKMSFVVLVALFGPLIFAGPFKELSSASWICERFWAGRLCCMGSLLCSDWVVWSSGIHPHWAKPPARCSALIRVVLAVWMEPSLGHNDLKEGPRGSTARSVHDRDARSQWPASCPGKMLGAPGTAEKSPLYCLTGKSREDF